MTLEELYRENYPLVYGYLLSLCGDPAQAEDLAADTFLRAIQRAGSYRGDCKPSTWLCAIGKNLYLNQRRRDGRHLPLEAAPPPGGRAVEEACLLADTAERIRRAAEELGSPYREVFFMRLQDLSFRQIGEAMGRSENWARVTCFRARAAIQRGLEEDHG